MVDFGKINMKIKNIILGAILVAVSLILSACETTDALFRIYYLDVQPAKPAQRVPGSETSAK